MAVIKAVNSRASIGRAVKYVTKDEKTEDKLITGKDCDPFHAIEDMKATKELWGKTGGREYKHYVQSFAEGENITPELAHKCACEWAEKEFKGYECLIATHTDKGHTHSHVIVNSVNFETGEKFRQSTKWLEQAKEHSDRICAEHGLTITEKGKTFDGQAREDMTAYSKDKYNLLEKADQGKAKSYVYDTALAVMDSKEQATSREDFVLKMAEKGYQTEWKDTKKHITFTDQEGHKVRASNLEKTFRIPFGKEQLEHEFEQNARSREAEPELSAEDRELYNTLHAIADRESRAEQAYNALNERYGEREDNGGYQNARQSAEERSPYAERTGASTPTPSETVRSITERVQSYSIEARSTFREHLQNLIRERGKSKSKLAEEKRRVAEIESRGASAEQKLIKLNTERSRTTDTIRELNERTVKHQSFSMER